MLLSIGRPAGISRIHGRLAQLHRVASIPVGLPQNPFGVRHVGHRLAVPGERAPLGGNPLQEGMELLALRVVAGELAAGARALGKDRLAVLAGDRSTPPGWTQSQLNRLRRRLPKQAAPLIERPNLPPFPPQFAGCEQEELAIGSPMAAALSLRVVPTGKHLVRIQDRKSTRLNSS